MNVAPPGADKRPLRSKRHTTNFIECYIELNRHQEAPRSFHLWTAISIIAGALGRHVYIDRGVYKIHPNLYILLVGLSGIMKKSTSAGTGVEILESVPDIQMLANQVTQASLIDRLARSRTEFQMPGVDRPVSQCSLYIHASEFKNFTNEVFGSLTESLTELYDCRGHFSRETKKEGQVKIFNPCLNMLGCTTSTWLKESIHPSQFGGGFASRILFVVENDPGKSVAIPKVDPDLVEKRERLIDDLHIISTYAGRMHMTPQAEEFFTEWYNAHREKLIKGGISPMFAGYAGRSGTMVEKLSMILVVNEGASLTIERRHVEEAAKHVESLARGMFDAFESVGGNALGPKILQVYNTIRRYPGISQSALSRQVIMDMGLDELRTAAQELEVCGAIARQVRDREVCYVPLFPEKTLMEVQQIPMRLRREQVHVVLGEQPHQPSSPSEPGSPSQPKPESQPQNPSQVRS